MLVDLSKPMTQAEFGELVGVSQQAVSDFLKAAALGPCTAREMLLAYCERLREVAAGRASSEAGGLDLVQERAALARSQRIAQDLKNAVAAGEYAPIGLLADVLALASSAVVDRFDQLEGLLRKACPDLPEEVKATLMTVIASARNEWIRATEQLVAKRLEDMLGEDDSPEAPDDGSDG